VLTSQAIHSAGPKAANHFAARHRCALTVLELSLAIVLLAIITSTSLKIIQLMDAQQRAHEQRLVALQAVQAVSEEIGNIPWQQLDARAAAEVKLPTEAASYLPNAKLNVSLHDEIEPVAKRVVVELTWSRGNKGPAAPVRLASWVFPDQTSNEERLRE